MRCGFEYCENIARWVVFQSNGRGVVMMTCAQHLGPWLASQTPQSGKRARTTYIVHRALYPKKSEKPSDDAQGTIVGDATNDTAEE